jgi:two-component system, OmpR family, sensor histidine kinase CiaH
MFTRARLRLTLLYAGLLVLTVALVAGAIGLLAVNDARSTDDRELKLRASALVAMVQRSPGPPGAYSDALPQGDGKSNNGSAGNGGGPDGPDRSGGDRPHPIEEQGLLDFILPVGADGRVHGPPVTNLFGLPDLAVASQAMQAGKASFSTSTVQGSPVRIYSVPVSQNGRVVAVVQEARSRYFVNSTVTRLVIVAVVAGLVGVLLSAAAGYWLAGVTLRPIANALERQRAFAADASHELRTPLTVMLTNTELLTLHPERPLSAYQDVVADILEEIRRLSRLVSELLTLARADQGKLAIAEQPVDLSELGQTVARQFVPLAEAKGVALRTEITPGVLLAGDRDRVQQLLVILLDNAVRYTPSGTVTLAIARQGHDAVLAVRDTGQGIAAEHLPRLFERFYRTDAARSSEDGGTGLGLALARLIVDAHKGRIEVQSVVGQGTTFTVHLPRASQDGRADREREVTPTGDRAG